jgi:hypothetical protein
MPKKYAFTLDIDPKKVRKRFNMPIKSTRDEQAKRPQNTTDLDELTSNKGVPEVVSFLDEAKKIHNCNVCISDFRTKKSLNDVVSECWWCLHPFQSMALGCPISHFPSRALKEYHSDISRDKYRIKENITPLKKESLNDSRVIIESQDHYETDGFFCSFHCVASYIDYNKHNLLYRLSESLLIKMYYSLMNSKIEHISRAPDQRMLKKRGGAWGIEEFRSKFNKVDMEYHGTIKSTVLFRPIATLYEEKLKF